MVVVAEGRTPCSRLGLGSRTCQTAVAVETAAVGSMRIADYIEAETAQFDSSTGAAAVAEGSHNCR